MAKVLQYNLKPQVALTVEAMQWDGTEENAQEIIAWFGRLHSPNESISHFIIMGKPFIMIKSGSFAMTAVPEDYIVRSAKLRSSPKKFSVYNKTAFEATFYEAAKKKPVLASDEAIAILREKLTGV